MKTKRAKIFTLICMFLLAVSMMGVTVYAIDDNSHSGQQGTGDKLSGGPSSMKTGVYVTVSVADSDGGASHAIGHGMMLKTQGGQAIPKFNVDAESKINGNHCAGGTDAPWPYPAFRAGSSAQGFGKTIVNWCKQDGAGGLPRAYTIAEKACGVSPSQIADLIADGKQVYLNFEPCMFCNNYGNTANSKGAIIVGLVQGIASQIPDTKTYISSVTRGGFPKAFMYELGKDWQLIKGVNPPSGLISTGEMKNKAIGYGICSIKFNQGLQVVIVCDDGNGNCETEYLTTDKTWNIVDPYKGCKWKESTFSLKKTTLTDPHATYSAICGSGQPNRSVGVGNQTFDIPAGEQALFIHYVGTPEEPELTETDLKSWETAYVMPKYAADREDGHEVNNEYTLAQHIQEKISEIESKTMACPHNGSHCEHVQATGHCVIDKVTCKDSEDWQNQTYGISADLGEFPNSIWNLYRNPVSGTKWDTFAKALGNDTRWTINKPVDPQFSYYLTRSHLEDVSVSPDREGIGATAKVYNTAPKYNWEMNYVGKEGASQKANSESTHTVEPYNYTYTAYGYDLKIYYHFEHDGLSYEEGEDQPDGLGGTHYVVTHSCEHSSHAFNESGGDWGGIGDSTVYEENRYTPSKWVGSTGGHKEDKFKTKAMPSGKNTNAGNIVDEKRGTKLVGKFVKGDTFEYEPITDQLVGSEFRDLTYTIYPEVAMSIWKCNDTDKYTNPSERLVYVMGEYPRHYTPSIAHSYKTKIDTPKMQGIGSLASAATGTAAASVPAYDLGVTAMGTTFEVATKSHYEMDIYTVGCNVTGSEANSKWGNEPSDVAASHEEYVMSIISGMRQELIMKMESSKFDRPLYYTLLGPEVHLTRTDEHNSVDVFWKMGTYNTEGTVRDWCNKMWGLGADAYEDAFQYTSNKMLNTMFVSCTDSAADNASMRYNPDPHVGNKLGGILELHGDHWYDEESKDKMKVEFYHTHLVFGNLMADDKVDYNLLTQDASSRLIGATDNIHVSFYTRMFNDIPFTTADGFTWDGHTGTYRVDKVYGTDFTVLNMTTAQMKK